MSGEVLSQESAELETMVFDFAIQIQVITVLTPSNRDKKNVPTGLRTRVHPWTKMNVASNVDEILYNSHLKNQKTDETTGTLHCHIVRTLNPSERPKKVKRIRF